MLAIFILNTTKFFWFSHSFVVFLFGYQMANSLSSVKYWFIFFSPTSILHFVISSKLGFIKIYFITNLWMIFYILWIQDYEKFKFNGEGKYNCGAWSLTVTAHLLILVYTQLRHYGLNVKASTRSYWLMSSRLACTLDGNGLSEGQEEA